MRVSLLSLGLLAVLTPVTLAWTKEDREIFRVRDEILTHEGPDVTFYEFIGVSPTASQDDVSKAYRKKTRSLHPDKVKQQLAAERAKKPKGSGSGGKKGSAPHVARPPTQAEINRAIKAASDRQARLSIVANILRGPGRARYDHFLTNGFPVWKGTGYYYNRYRPGLGTVLFGVFLFAGGATHYIALYMGWRRQREFIERYIKFARHAAWGGDSLGFNIPGVDTQPAVAPAADDMDDEGRMLPMNRKQRRMQERDAKREAAKDGQTSARRGGGRRLGSTPTATTSSGTATPQPGTAAAQQGPSGTKKRVVAENGKVLVVDSLGDVYLEQEDEDGFIQEFLLDPNEIPRPTINDTALVRLPIWFYNLTIGRVLPKRDGQDGGDDVRDEEDEEDDSEGPGKRTPSTDDSNEDFEILEKASDDIDVGVATAKASGSSKQVGGGKANKRKSKKK